MSAIVLSVGGAYFTRAQQCYSDLKDGRSIRDFGHCAHTRHAQPGVNASLATDSVKANNRLDMFVVIKFASLLHKGVSSDPRVLPRGEILDMATRAGAAALDLPVGAIAPGKKADLVLVRLDGFHVQPSVADTIVTNLVHAARGSDVVMVMVDRRVVVT
jgi:5-methylthioadenosine/S-adenosylhomocysteine deaminase